MRRFELALPRSIDEALRVLSDRGPDAKLLAGGTDLLPQMKNGLVKPAKVVDLSGIPELQKLEVDGDGALHIGAAVSARTVVMALTDGFTASIRRRWASTTWRADIPRT